MRWERRDELAKQGRQFRIRSRERRRFLRHGRPQQRGLPDGAAGGRLLRRRAKLRPEDSRQRRRHGVSIQGLGPGPHDCHMCGLSIERVSDHLALISLLILAKVLT